MDTVMQSYPPDIKIFANPRDLFNMLAADFIQRALTTVQQKGIFTVVLTGGETAKSYYAILAAAVAKQQLPWQQILFFFGDERYVAKDSSANNYHMAYTELLSKLPIPRENIYPILTDFSDPKTAAQEYETTIRNAIDLRNNGIPNFDLLYLGLGANGHVASLMPYSDVVMTYCSAATATNTDQLVAALWVADLNMYRITLTPPVLNNSSCITFMVTGANKAAAVQQVLEGVPQPCTYPAQLIQSNFGANIWYLDQAAACKLQNMQQQEH